MITNSEGHTIECNSPKLFVAGLVMKNKILLFQTQSKPNN